MRDVLMQLFQAIVALAATAIMYYAVPYLKAKAATTKYAEAVKFAEDAVRAMYQKYDSGAHEEKKQEALKLVANYCNQHGVKITEEELDTLVESAVNAVKNASK